ncbi:hypothetical protein J4E85_003746 [Alternaria conjuncta]|uniref:uncharacterized protein n=1 Tax=Alternaria conjuncta TaxID=181017 RepID=UPI0022210805|nr:uncharacterized protein J4E85_003746 [Alternaria conjuncta]KAI4931157.1 hypothetical protein J4E85_003746 [Alternaria conjuncta]
MKQQKSSGGEGTQFPPRAQETSMPQNRQDQLIINQFAKKLMETATPEIMQKFESDVSRWPEDKKRQLLAQGIPLLFLRFRQHADMLYRRGALNTLATVNTGDQVDRPQQVASIDIAGLSSNPDAVGNSQAETASLDPSEAYRQGQANETANGRIRPHSVLPSETYPNISDADPPSSFRRGSSYLSVQDSVEHDQPALLSSNPVHINRNDHHNALGSEPFLGDPTAPDNFDFDSFWHTGDDNYDDAEYAPAALQPRSLLVTVGIILWTRFTKVTVGIILWTRFFKATRL